MQTGRVTLNNSGHSTCSNPNNGLGTATFNTSERLCNSLWFTVATMLLQPFLCIVLFSTGQSSRKHLEIHRCTPTSLWHHHKQHNTYNSLHINPGFKNTNGHTTPTATAQQPTYYWSRKNNSLPPGPSSTIVVLFLRSFSKPQPSFYSRCFKPACPRRLDYNHSSKFSIHSTLSFTMHQQTWTLPFTTTIWQGFLHPYQQTASFTHLPSCWSNINNNTRM